MPARRHPFPEWQSACTHHRLDMLEASERGLAKLSVLRQAQDNGEGRWMSKIAVVTGAGSGIGAAAATALAT